MNLEQPNYDQDTASEHSGYEHTPVIGLLGSSASSTENTSPANITPETQTPTYDFNDNDASYSSSQPGILDESGQFRPKWWENYTSLSETGKTLKKFKSPEALAKSYAELEKLRAYPDPTDEDRMSKYRSFLGLPENSGEYKLAPPSLTEGMESCWDNDLADKVAATAYKYAIPHVALQAIADVFTEEQSRYLQNYEMEENRRLALKQEELFTELKDSWGSQCRSRLNSAANTLQQLCAEAEISPEALANDPLIGSHPDFIKLLDHVGKLINDKPLKGAEKSSINSALSEAQRMENDPSHPLHEAYMDHNHPNHEYANKLYDQAFLVR